MAGIALHQSVQTTTFVQEWHRKCQLCLGSQSHTNEEINHRLVDLENTVLLLGEVQNLTLQTHLKSDWNITTFCVTPQEYNQSEYS